MEVLNKLKIEISLVIYWLANVANTIYVSRSPGFYLKEVMEKARALAMLKPYLWTEIFVVSGIIGIATIGLYLIIKKAKNKALVVMIYSFAMLFLFTVLVPTDIGGVHIAIAMYIACTFIFTLVYAAFNSWLKKFGTKNGHRMC